MHTGPIKLLQCQNSKANNRKMGEPVADFELTAKTFFSVRKNEERNSEAESQLTRIWAVVA